MFSKLKIHEKPGVVEWAERCLVLPRETSPNAPGRFSTARMPYMREPLESIREEGLQHIYWCFGTQSGKTVSLLIAAAYFIDNDPAPMLWALPTEILARSFSRARLQPLISKNDVLARHKRRDPDAFTAAEMRLDSMELYMVGVSEPGNLSSRPIMRCVMDEEAKYKHENKEEAHPVDLIEERAKGFHRYQILHASTPSSEDSYFWQNFITTDMRKFYVPCPRCGEMMPLEFSRNTVQWERREDLEGDALADWVQDHTFYVCPHCEGRVEDWEKIGMMEKGEWRPTNPNASRARRGYHLNSLYSPFVTWGQMARKFIVAQNDLFRQVALHNFRNGWEALPFTQYEIKVGDDSVRGLRGVCRRGELPRHYYYLVVAYDPGQNQTHWVAQAIGRGGETWVVDWGTLLGISTTDATPGIGAHFESLEWGGVRPDFGLIDSGDWAQKVYDECYKYYGKLWPTKGSGANFGSWNVSEVKSHPGLELYLYVDRTAKMELYAGRIQKGAAPALHLPEDADQDLLAGLSGQQLEKPRGGGLAQWRKLPNDHYGDCVKIGQVSWWVRRGDFCAEEMNAIEERKQNEGVPEE